MVSMTHSSYIFETILLSAIAVIALAWVSIRITDRIGLIDFPGSAPHKLHTVPTPLAGGIALMMAILFTGTIFDTLQEPAILAAYLSSMVVFAFGMWDDYKGISPLVKICGQVIAALLLIWLGVSVRVFESPAFFFYFPGSVGVFLDSLLTVLWVVGITNAFNFVDSMDGLAVGLGGVAAAFFMLVMLDANQIALSQHSAVILGICFGLYFFNAPPAHLFLGDSGAQTLGFTLAALGIAYVPKGVYQTSSWVVPILLLGVPIFDMVLVIFSRLRRKRPVYEAAKDHTYHRLVHWGIDSNRVVMMMHLGALMLGCLAAISLTQIPLIANGIFLLVIVLGGLLIIYLDQRKRWP
jgi:UDP-GlcNAc:undecaprenyl-phosphate GlcNAc-1-phosphate transferase